MKFKFPLVAAFAAIVTLSACGGGGDDSPSAPPPPNPTQFAANNTVVGTGAEATAGKRATVAYTGWLYTDTGDHKGAKFDSNTITITVGAPGIIKGFDQGVTGMKVGGKRTLIIPANLGYGAAGNPPAIPGNAGLVFDVELKAVQ